MPDRSRGASGGTCDADGQENVSKCYQMLHGLGSPLQVHGVVRERSGVAWKLRSNGAWSGVDWGRWANARGLLEKLTIAGFEELSELKVVGCTRQ